MSRKLDSKCCDNQVLALDQRGQTGLHTASSPVLKRKHSQTFSAVHSADEQHASAANLHIMPEEQPPAKRAYKRYCHPWSVAPQVADVPPYIAKNPPSLVDGIKIGRSEQHELFNWVRKQLHVRPGLDQGILPPERPYLKSWDAKVHKRLGQLARQIKDKRRSKHETGSGSMGPFGHLANVWGFMNVKKGKSSDYSSETLKEHAQACNTSFISESKLECSSETVQDTILFTVEYARVWSNQPANPYRLHKVLTHALGNTGVGLAGIGEQTGMKLGYVHKGCIYVKIVQPGQGPAHEQLRRHLIKHATHSPHLMQVNVVPTLTVLGSISEQLRSAVKDYKKEERKASNCGQTGQQVLAQDLGWHAASSLQYPSGHWQDLSNCQAAVHDFIREHQWDGTPPMTVLRKELPGMTAAVVRVLFPNCGWRRFVRSCGLEPLGIPNGTLTQQYVDELLHEFVAASETPHLMPTQPRLRAVARDASHPMQRFAGSLQVSISRKHLGGGWPATAARLGFELQGYEPIADQERDLLASVLSENPCLAWTKVTSRYCKAALAANLPVRTASSLTHMLARAAETGLQLAKCARMLGLCSSQQTDQLDNLVAADLHLLERLLVHGRQLRKLCSIACEDTFTVLKALPAHVTDEEWTRNLFEQCEIEADVALWHSGLRKAGFRRRSRKEVWARSELAAFHVQRFRLKLDDNLVSVLRDLVQQALTAGVEPTVWIQHGSQHGLDFKSQAAFDKLQQLAPQSEGQFSMRSIHDIPLVQTAEGLIHNPLQLPALPKDLQHHHVKWSPFHRMNFEKAKTLLQQAGAWGGVYQIWLCLYETLPDGTERLLMRTEWYVGSGIVLASRVMDYVPVSKCGPPGPKWEATKRMLFQAAWERGFDFEIRFLQLGGMSLSEVRAVEDHYLQFKWPLNKVHNGNLRVHPDWLRRLVAPVKMLQHISLYCENLRRKQGLSRLGINAGPGQSNASDNDDLDEFDCEGNSSGGEA